MRLVNILVITIITVLSILPVSGAVAATGADFSLVPDNQTVSVGQVVSIDIRIDAGEQEMDTVDVHLGAFRPNTPRHLQGRAFPVRVFGAGGRTRKRDGFARAGEQHLGLMVTAHLGSVINEDKKIGRRWIIDDSENLGLHSQIRIGATLRHT